MRVYYDSTGDGTENAEITNIISFPVPIRRLNKISSCSVTIHDRNGALYGTFGTLDFCKMKVTDNATPANVLFRGYNNGVVYKHDKTTINMRGIGAVLEWDTFNKSYILAQGKVKDPRYDGGDIAMTYATIYPNNASTENWSSTEGNHEDAVNNSEVTSYISCTDGEENNTDVFTFADGDLNITQITQVVVDIYSADVSSPDNATVEVSDDNGGSWEAAQQIASTASAAWTSYTFAGLNANALSGKILVRITAPAALGAGEFILIYGLHINITFTGDTPEVIELMDNEDGTFGWTPDDYWSEEQDTGLLIVDNSSNYLSKVWEAESVAANNEDGGTEFGNAASTQAINVSSYGAEDSSNPKDMSLDFNLDSDGTEDIDASTYTLGYLHFRIVGALASSTGGASSKFYVKLYNHTNLEYDTIKTISWYANPAAWFDYSWDIAYNLTDYVKQNGGNYDEIDMRIELASDANAYTYTLGINYVSATVYYAANTITPIMEQIDGSGDEWIYVQGINWEDRYVEAEDNFIIGQNTGAIISDLSAHYNIEIELISDYSKYIGSWFRGKYGLQILKHICNLEEWDFYEDMENDKLVVGHRDDFTDSTVDLTAADYEWDWEYHDSLDYYKKVEVFGNAAYNIYQSIEDNTSKSLKTKSIIDETLSTEADAYARCESEWNKYNSKVPSIILTLDGVQANIELGTTVDIDMDEPDFIDDTLIVRRIDRMEKGATGIKTKVYLGLGQSPVLESLSNRLDDLAENSRKALSDRLISTPYASGAGISWSDIGGADAGVVSALNTADKYLKNDANDETTGDLTVANLITAGNVDGVDISAHDGGIVEDYHDFSTLEFGDIANMAKYTDGEAVNAMGAKGDANPLHHDRYEDAEAVAAIEADDSIYTKVETDDLDDSHQAAAEATAAAALTAHHAAACDDHDDRYYTETELNNGQLDNRYYTETELTNKSLDLEVNTLTVANPDESYDPDGWNGDFAVPSRDACRDVFVGLTGAVSYQGTWDPANAYPATGKGYYYVVSADGYHAADGIGTPERWYEIGDWIIYNDTDTQWDILRNTQGDNILKVSPGDNIQTAIDEIESIGAGKIILLAGNHELSSGLTIDNADVDITIEGLGDASVLDLDDNITGITVSSCSTVILRNFKINMENIVDDIAEKGIFVDDYNNVIVDGVNIYGDAGQKGIGIYFFNELGYDNETMTIMNCRLHDLHYGILCIDYVKIIDNTVYNCEDYGIQCNSYCTVHGNIVDGNDDTTVGILADSYSTVVGNIVFDCDTGLTSQSLVTVFGNVLYSNTTDWTAPTTEVGVQYDGTDLLLIGGTGDVKLKDDLDCGDKAIKEVKSLVFQDGGATITQFDTAALAASDTKVPTNTTVMEYVNTRKGYETLQMFGDSSSEINTQIVLDAVNDDVRVYFYVHDQVDTSEDVVFSFIHTCSSADATVAMKKYVDSAAVGSEGISWRISSAVAWNLDSTTANREYKTDLTISAADISDGDVIVINFRLNEASRTVYFQTCSVAYTREA